MRNVTRSDLRQISIYFWVLPEEKQWTPREEHEESHAKKRLERPEPPVSSCEKCKGTRSPTPARLTAESLEADPLGTCVSWRRAAGGRGRPRGAEAPGGVRSAAWGTAGGRRRVISSSSYNDEGRSDDRWGGTRGTLTGKLRHTYNTLTKWNFWYLLFILWGIS